MRDRDPQIQEVIRAIKSLEGQINGVIQAIESGQKWQHIISIATLASVLIAGIAFAISVGVNFGSAKREADVAASEALMRHYQFAAQHPKSDRTPEHAIYTANIIVDLTEAPGEQLPWRNTARRLLKRYEHDVSREDFRCKELDKQFKTLVKEVLDYECTTKSQQGEQAIHPTAWKKNSANFAFWAFSEVPHSPAPTPGRPGQRLAAFGYYLDFSYILENRCDVSYRTAAPNG